jgi:hypothetical protein
VAIESFGTSCDETFKQVYPYITGHKKGTLRTVIYSILDRLHAEEICQQYGIEKDASLDDDLDLSDDIIYTVLINQQKLVKQNPLIKKGGETAKDVTKPFRKFLNANEDKDKMEFIVVAAVILVGAYVAQKFLSKPPIQSIAPAALSSQPIPTAICLAVPASSVYGLTSGDLINREKIIELIEIAPEFLCIKADEADRQIIDTINQEIVQNSQLKFYIRIDIPNGQDIINAKTKYVIKRDILHTEGKIIQLGRLRDASILKTFNRI